MCLPSQSVLPAEVGSPAQSGPSQAGNATREVRAASGTHAANHGVCPWKSKMRRRNKVSRGYLSLLRRCLRSELSPPLLLRPSRWSLSSRRSLPPPRSSRLLCSRSLSLPDSSSRLLEEICVITGQRFQISMKSKFVLISMCLIFGKTL